MAVAVRAVAGESVSEGGTPNITIAAGDFAIGGAGTETDEHTIDSATLGGTAMTAVGASNWVRAFRLLDPDVAPGTGSRTFTPVPSAGAVGPSIVALLTGVNESDPIGEVGGPNATSSSGSTTRITSAGDRVLVWVRASGSASVAVSAQAGTTEEYDATEEGSVFALFSKLASGSSTTVEWTFNETVLWRGHAVVIKAGSSLAALDTTLAPAFDLSATMSVNIPTTVAAAELTSGFTTSPDGFDIYHTGDSNLDTTFGDAATVSFGTGGPAVVEAPIFAELVMNGFDASATATAASLLIRQIEAMLLWGTTPEIANVAFANPSVAASLAFETSLDGTISFHVPQDWEPLGDPTTNILHNYGRFVRLTPVLDDETGIDFVWTIASENGDAKHFISINSSDPLIITSGMELP
jgi:hypothetical protein